MKLNKKRKNKLEKHCKYFWTDYVLLLPYSRCLNYKKKTGCPSARHQQKLVAQKVKDNN